MFHQWYLVKTISQDSLIRESVSESSSVLNFRILFLIINYNHIWQWGIRSLTNWRNQLRLWSNFMGLKSRYLNVKFKHHVSISYWIWKNWFILISIYLFYRFWWLQITVLADGGDWLELEKFSKSKKSPIGYEVIFDQLFNHVSLFLKSFYVKN